MRPHSSREEREAILARWLSSGLSLRAFSQHEDIPVSTLHKWKEKHHIKEVSVPEKSPTEKWTAEQKFAVVLEASTLTVEELSAYCREKGLYPEQAAAWKEACTR